MLRLQRIQTNSKYYPFVEELLETAFPPEERRDTELQRSITNGKEHFHCNLIHTSQGECLGVITYWDFRSFVFIEHFAITPDYQGMGYGSQVLQMLQEQTSIPLLLEVEMPQRAHDAAYRRIAFYRRQGFKLRHSPYRQPPYRLGGEWLPMKLMMLRKFKPGEIGMAIKTIYREVYDIYV